jgi:hypothetical protein
LMHKIGSKQFSRKAKVICWTSKRGKNQEN